MHLNHVRAVVTGGASGLGFAVAKFLVANGGKVALFDVNAERGAAAVAELRVERTGLGEPHDRDGGGRSVIRFGPAGQQDAPV